MDTVNYEIIKNINRDIIKSQQTQKYILDDLKKISNNSNLKYLNFKVIGSSLAAGLLLGALSMSGFAYYKIKSMPVNTVEKVKTVEKIVNNNKNDKYLKALENKLSELVLKNKNLSEKNSDLKAKNSKLFKEIKSKNNIIANLHKKVLPSKYYYTDESSGRMFIIFDNNDERFFSASNSNSNYLELK